MDRLLKVGDVFEVTLSKVVGDLPTYGVVYKTAMTGGGTGHGPNDIYPNGYQVSYIDLDKTEVDKIANGKKVKIVVREDIIGRRRSFYQTGCFTSMVAKSDVRLIKTVSVDEDKIYTLS